LRRAHAGASLGRPLDPVAEGVTSREIGAKYRTSPLPWAPHIPAHWQTKRGKALLARSNLSVADSSEIVTCFRDGQVTLRKNRRTRGFMEAVYEVGYQGVRRGQLVVHAMDAFAGAIGVSDSDGKCTPEYIVCDPRSPEIVPSYYALVLRYAAHQDFIRASCPAVRERAPRFRYPNLGDMQLPLPTREEQAAVVRFLDHANRRIDRFIRAKRRLIALLNEQKQAIVHRAVTRGLDPRVPTKDSGVPWLGQIPAHWEPRRAKQLCTQIVDCKNRTPLLVEGGEHTVVRTTNTKNPPAKPGGFGELAAQSG
jgi:type I restriction enzyme, S subunit